MHSNTTVEPLFILNPNVSTTELQNAVHERLTKIKAITNYMLADCSGGDPTVSRTSQCDALWLIEELTDEAEQLIIQTQNTSELKAPIHPDAAEKASDDSSPDCTLDKVQPTHIQPNLY